MVTVSSTASALEAATRAERVSGVDRLRGLVMIVMALDHVRDYFANASFGVTDLEHTTPGYFITRWITHLCAPVFMLLAGTAVALRERRVGREGLAGYVAKRGAFLILLELTIVHYAWTFDLHYPRVRLLVLWALGGAMLVLAGLVALRLSRRAIAIFGIVVVVAHNLLDQFHPGGPWALPWSLLHEPNLHPLAGTHKLFVLYPLVPWIGVIALGYALGSIVDAPAPERRRTLTILGLGLTLGFIALRLVNGYGDPGPWSAQPRGALFTVFSFLNVEKYPPSLDYLLATLGPALLGLVALEHLTGPLARMLEAFGRVPLFFYVVHLYVIHLLYLAAGRTSLAGVYLVWLLVTGLLLPASMWFGRLKARRRDLAWLSYF
jgi:uncharacterized membrane protein